MSTEPNKCLNYSQSILDRVPDDFEGIVGVDCLGCAEPCGHARSAEWIEEHWTPDNVFFLRLK